MGCFWGAERMFWQTPGVYSTAVGYGGAFTPNATYEEVCTGKTGHTELVLVAYDPTQVSYEALLTVLVTARSADWTVMSAESLSLAALSRAREVGVLDWLAVSN